MNDDQARASSTIQRWFRAACRPEIVQRSIRVALIVGTILVAVNYTDRWMKGTLVPIDYLKMLVTYLVPYCVSTYASVATLHSSDNT